MQMSFSPFCSWALGGKFQEVELLAPVEAEFLHVLGMSILFPERLF